MCLGFVWGCIYEDPYTWAISFIHSLNEYLLTSTTDQGGNLSPEDIAVNKVPAPKDLIF